jgi:hypothetical protein
MEEIWKTIELFPKYSISSERRVRNNKTGRILNHGSGNRIMVSDNGRSFPLHINKLMDEYFGDKDEIWRIVDEARDYEVSTHERVRNRRTGSLLKLKIRPSGRVYVQFTDAGYQFERPLWYIMERAFGR